MSLSAFVVPRCVGSRLRFGPVTLHFWACARVGYALAMRRGAWGGALLVGTFLKRVVLAGVLVANAARYGGAG